MTRDFEQRLQNEFEFMRNKNEQVRHYNFSGKRELMEAVGFDTEIKYSRYEIYGCECGDGWYETIRGLCLDITAAYDEKGLEIDVVPVLIKEKFGEFRFYFDIGSSDMKNTVKELADKYRKLSKSVCAYCGGVGYVHKELYWVIPLCDGCYSKHIEGGPERLLRTKDMEK